MSPKLEFLSENASKITFFIEQLTQKARSEREFIKQSGVGRDFAPKSSFG